MNKLFTTLTTIGAAMVLTACAGTTGPKSNALPLDHGPRAQATPWQNKQQMLHAAQRTKSDVAQPPRDSNQ